MSKPGSAAQKIIDFLGCPCTYFPAGKSRKHITAAYEDAFGKRNISGSIPVIVVVDDTLAEWIDMLQQDFKDGETVSDYRNRLLQPCAFDAVNWFREQLSELKSGFGENWDTDVIGTTDDGEANNFFRGFMEFDDKKAKECILARIPTDKPWEVFAWMPFGGWNECPAPDIMIPVCRYWYERYGAIPAVISHDTLEFAAKPITDTSAAVGAALEQFAFCTDVVFQGYGTVGTLADSLTKSFVWYFWWD